MKTWFSVDETNVTFSDICSTDNLVWSHAVLGHLHCSLFKTTRRESTEARSRKHCCHGKAIDVVVMYADCYKSGGMGYTSVYFQ